MGIRGLAAVVGTIMLTLGASNAAAQSSPLVKTSFSLNSASVDLSAQPLGTAAAAPVVSAVQRTVDSTTSMFSNALGAVFGTQTDPQQVAIAKIAREGNWLYKSGWPLYALVDKFSAGAPLDDQATCLATAVYFEARGESLEGQLAVAHVVLNRAASDKYPASWCDVVKQPWQFSFVRHGEFPRIDAGSAAWAKAQGIARLAMANVVPSIPTDVLWYHANYVAPSWEHRLNFVEQIGAHIFYRA